MWTRNGLSHPELGTLEGRVLFDGLEPAMLLSRALGGPTLEGMLLARHRIIDELLASAIDDGRVSQVIEIACGMSPRGWRFAERYGDRITYIEADLPDMAERKRRALERIADASPAHRVVEIDALRDRGPRSLASTAATLDRERGLAIVTEGLVTYFDEIDVRGMWRRFARELRKFSTGLYLADLRLAGSDFSVPERAFGTLLSSFVRRRVHTHFGDEDAALDALRAAGFDEARVHRGDRHPAAGERAADPGAHGIHVVEAETRSA